MKFGKLLDLRGVDFSLPTDHPQTERVLAAHAQRSPQAPQIYLGATGWGNKEWLGTWYPTRTKPAEFLRPYSRQFQTIEFNSTHYRVPDEATVERWYQLSEPDFRFCPKLPQFISHKQRLRNAHSSTDEFLNSVSGLREKLGPIFMQLPENFGPSEVDFLLAYLEDWPRTVPLYLEMRHPEWFQGGPAAEAVYAQLEELGYGTVISDVAGRRDVLHMRLPNPVLVLRFVGNGGHPSDAQRANDWVQRLKQWLDQGLRSAWLFIHQPEMHMVPDHTVFWAQRIREVCGIDVKYPQPVEEARQQSLF